MRHRQFYVEQLTASERDLPSRGGMLMVVSHDESPDLDWELVHQTSEIVHLEKLPYQLTMTGPEGTLSGDAVLVRSDGRSHVFRGAGDLDGFDSDELSA